LRLASMMRHTEIVRILKTAHNIPSNKLNQRLERKKTNWPKRLFRRSDHAES
jgi:hypothetical protein